VIRKIGYPVVIKPLDGNHGKGSSINVNDWESAKIGLEHAQKYQEKLLLKNTSGYDFRVLVINNKMVAAARRVPASRYGRWRTESSAIN
jgi:cyanophycin synthetase